MSVLPAIGGIGIVAREAARAAVSRIGPTRGDVPLRVEDVTPAWLSSTLGLPDGAIRSVDVVDGDSGTAARARIAIDVDPAAAIPENLFVKFTPRSFLQHVLMNSFALGAHEVLVYRTFADSPPVRVPRCYAAVIDEGRGRNLMVLEDLSGTAQFRTVVDSVSVSEAEAVVDALATLHATYWGRRFPARLTPLVGRPAAANALGDVIRRGLLGDRNTVAAEHVPAEMRRQARMFYERSGDIDRFWQRGPQTLLHGDTHLGNLFFEGEAPGFLDWQVAMSGPGIRDVAYFAAASMEPDDLRLVERTLVGRYAAGLVEGGVDVDVDDLWERYRAAATELYLAAVSTAGAGESMQSAEVATVGVQRAVAACEAHDSFAVLDRLISA